MFAPQSSMQPQQFKPTMTSKREMSPGSTAHATTVFASPPHVTLTHHPLHSHNIRAQLTPLYATYSVANALPATRFLLSHGLGSLI